MTRATLLLLSVNSVKLINTNKWGQVSLHTHTNFRLATDLYVKLKTFLLKRYISKAFVHSICFLSFGRICLSGTGEFFQTSPPVFMGHLLSTTVSLRLIKGLSREKRLVSVRRVVELNQDNSVQSLLLICWQARPRLAIVLEEFRQVGDICHLFGWWSPQRFEFGLVTSKYL